MNDNCIIDFYYCDKKGSGTVMHSHKNYQLIYLCKGTVRLEADEKSYECKAPSLLFISSLEEHRITVLSDEYERYVMSIDSSAAKKAISNHLLTIFSTHKIYFCHYLNVCGNKHEIDYIINTIYSEYMLKEQDIENGCNIWLNALLNRVYRINPNLFTNINSTANQIVLDVKEQLETDLNRQIRLSELAQKNFISVYYLSHIFKEATGYSVNQYRLLIRLSYAKQLLLQSNYDILEISQLCGFSDFSNFCRYFKNKVGLTPSEFRLKHKNKNSE